MAQSTKFELVINAQTAKKAHLVKRCRSLPVAEVRHQCCQIGPRNDVEQFFLVG